MFPHVSTEALMCALVLSEEGNLGRTAERLHTSHSNVGRKLRTLQSTWGVELFRRSLKGFELTDEGRRAIPELRRSINHVQRGFDQAIYLSVKNRRPLLIGHSLYIHETVLPYLERQSISGSDFSRIILKADTTVHLVTQVLRGLLHIGFGVAPIQDKDLWIAPIARENFAACISAEHPFRERIRLSIHDLVGEAIYWMPRSVHPAFYRQITEYLFGIGVEPHNLHEARAIIQGIDLAASRLGIALVPESAARFRHPGVLFKPLTDRLIYVETVVFARRDQMHDGVSDFIEAALKELNPRRGGLQ